MMNARFRVAALLASMVFALTLAGCGANGGGQSPQAAEHAGGHDGHAEHAADGATDNAATDNADPAGASPDASATDDAKPQTPETPVYTLDAAVEQREDGCYLLVETNLKLSKENYGLSPVEGEGHIHLYINGSLIGPITDFEPVLLNNLKEGENVVRVELAKNNHSVIPGTSKTVVFDYASPET